MAKGKRVNSAGDDYKGSVFSDSSAQVARNVESPDGPVLQLPEMPKQDTIVAEWQKNKRRKTTDGLSDAAVAFLKSCAKQVAAALVASKKSFSGKAKTIQFRVPRRVANSAVKIVKNKLAQQCRLAGWTVRTRNLGNKMYYQGNYGNYYRYFSLTLS